MAITLGTFTKLDNGAFTGTLKTLNVTASLTIVPVDKMSDNAPDHRVYAGQRYEVGAGWSQVAKSSGETYLNLKIGAPEFGPNWVRCRLVKLETAGRRRRHPHRPLGTARLSERRSPRRGITRGGAFLFRSSSGRIAKRLASADCPNQDPSRRNSDHAMPNRAGSRMRGLPQFCRAQRARMRAPVIIHARQNRLPRAPLRGACGVLDPARPGMTAALPVFQHGRRAR